MVRLSRNSRPQTQIGIRMGICMLWRQGFIPCHGDYPILELYVKPGRRMTIASYAGRFDVVGVEFSRRHCFNVIAVRRTVFL